MFRLMRSGHEDAMVYADAPAASEDQLRKFYEEEVRPNMGRYRKRASELSANNS
jgi:hypothetical protein